MQRIVLKTRYWQPDSYIDSVPGFPVNDRVLGLREIFSETSSQGREISFHITCGPNTKFWIPRDTASPAALLKFFHLFRYFHTVIFYINLDRKEKGTDFWVGYMALARRCVDNLRAFRNTLELVLGPGTNVVTDKAQSPLDESEYVYADYTVYHPRSYIKAMERQYRSD